MRTLASRSTYSRSKHVSRPPVADINDARSPWCLARSTARPAYAAPGSHRPRSATPPAPGPIAGTATSWRWPRGLAFKGACRPRRVARVVDARATRGRQLAQSELAQSIGAIGGNDDELAAVDTRPHPFVDERRRTSRAARRQRGRRLQGHPCASRRTDRLRDRGQTRASERVPRRDHRRTPVDPVPHVLTVSQDTAHARASSAHDPSLGIGQVAIGRDQVGFRDPNPSPPPLLSGSVMSVEVV